MKKGTEAFILSIGIVVVLLISYRYDQDLVEKNFVLHVDSACDPSAQSCFQVQCTAGDIECDPSPYEKVDILDKSAPSCLEEHDCSNFSCNGLSQCNITYCSTSSLEDGETCVGTNQ